MATNGSQRWTVADSAELYNIRSWGNNYFSINDLGNVTVEAPEGAAIDLKELVDEVRERGIGLPLLLRFPHILKARVVELNEAFQRAMREYGYRRDLPRRLPDQGQPGPLRRRASGRVRASPTTSASRRARSRSSSR